MPTSREHLTSVFTSKSPHCCSYVQRSSSPWCTPWHFSCHSAVLVASSRHWSTRTRTMLLCIFLVLLETTGVLGMRVNQVIVPRPAIVGQSARLQCLWDATDKEFYSIRWYINDKQFYSFIKGSPPEKILHKTDGFTIEVDTENSDENVVTLRNVKPIYEGNYRCELMSDGPTFQSAVHSSNLSVVHPPNTPVISGFRHDYRLPDKLRVNCTARNSLPEAIISFYVNGNLIHQDSGRVTKVGVVKNEHQGTFSSSSELTLPLSDKYLPELKLTCRAQVKGFDYKTEASETANVHRASFFTFFSTGNVMFSGTSQALITSVVVVVQILQGQW